VSASDSCGTPHALGVEGGLLSLLNAREGPNAVPEIISSQRYSIRTMHNELAYIQIVCS
jgi:hypothetical protein